MMHSLADEDAQPTLALVCPGLNSLPPLLDELCRGDCECLGKSMVA